MKPRVHTHRSLMVSILNASICAALGLFVFSLTANAQSASTGKKSMPAALQQPAAQPLTPQQQSTVELEHQASIRNAGFMGWTAGGMMSGMMDRNLSIDALQVRLAKNNAGGVWYAVCTDDGTWQAWTRNGETAGKAGQANIQAIALRLYDVPGMGIEYRVHLTGGDWLAWTSNGDVAGSIGQGKTLDAVEIRLQQNAPPEASVKGEALPPQPGSTAQAAPQVTMSASKKKSSSTQDNTQAAQSSPDRVESFKVKEEPEPKKPVTTTQSSNQAQTGQSATNQSSGNPSSNTQTSGNPGSGTQNQADWGNVANTAGNLAGQAMNGASNGMNTNANRTNTQFSNNQYPNNQYSNSNFNQTPNNQNWSEWTHQPMQRAQGFSQPVFVPIASRRVALMANNNRYITAINDPRNGALFVATRPTIGETELFELAFLGEHRVALKTLNGRYLSLQRTANGNSIISPTADIISTNEAFEIMNGYASDRTGDRFIFKAAGGQSLSVEEFGQYRLFGKEGLSGAWESFAIVLPDGRPILAETQAQPSAWQTRQDASGRVIVLDGQGRTVDASDRVLLLVANPSNASQNQGSLATNAVAPISTIAEKPSDKATEKPAPKPVADPKTYLAPIEMDIVQELNFARTKPGEYATLLESYRKYYKGKTFTAPGQKALATKEGVKALDEVILMLKMTRPLEALAPAHALTKAARDHVDNTGPKGTLGHVGTDKSNPNDRAARYGTGVVSENICYGRSTAREVVIRLLIDDGTADRGYRKNILNPAFKLVGTAFGLHKTQQTMCSQVFAAGYEEK